MTEEVKAAYKKTAAGCQLDRGGSYARLVLINSAGAVLTDPSNRTAYDAERKVVAVYGPGSSSLVDSGNGLVNDFLNARYEYAPWLGGPPKIVNSRSGGIFFVFGIMLGIVMCKVMDVLIAISPQRGAIIAVCLLYMALALMVGPSLGAVLHWTVRWFLQQLFSIENRRGSATALHQEDRPTA